MPVELCRKCNKWTLLKQDRYCGWCGNSLFGLKLKGRKSRVFLPPNHSGGTNGGASSMPVEVIVVNDGQWSAEATIEVDKPWLTAPGPLLSLNPGVEEKVKLELNLEDESLKEIVTAQITAINKNAADLAKKVVAKVEFIPSPTFTVALNNGPLYLDGGRETITGAVILKSGILNIDGSSAVTVDEPWVEITLPDNPEFPLRLDLRSQSKLNFNLKVDKRQLISSIDQGSNQETIVISLQDHNYPEINIEALFELKLRWPPFMEIRGAGFDEINLRALVGHKKNHTLTIYNQGDETLKIDAVEVADDSTNSWLKIETVIPKAGTQSDFPIEIEKGNYAQLNIIADAADLKVGDYQTELTITSNADNMAEKSLKLLFNVFIKKYQGVVCFDYGTTNSDVAIFSNDAASPEVAPLDNGRAIIPSSIVYESLQPTPEGEQRVYRVGFYAQEMSADPKALGSIFHSVKSDLGRDLTYRVRFYRDGRVADLSPQDVAGDVIKYLLYEVEDYLQEQVKSCIITHPSRFSPLQLNKLSEAFVNQGLTIKEMAHEPVAAAIDYIIDNYKKIMACKDDRYTMLVCDFGGGTTDFALLQVEVKEENQGDDSIVTITPQVLGATACRHFGGDDVTEAVAESFAKKIISQAKEKVISVPDKLYYRREDLIKLADQVSKADFSRALYNSVAIRNVADAAKIKCPKKTKKSMPIAISIMDNDNQKSVFHFEFNQDQLNECAKKAGVVDAVGDCWEFFNGLGVNSLNTLLVAGRASQLPLVRKCLKDIFAEQSTLVFAGNSADQLKHCVVKGAARLEVLKRHGGNIIIDFAGMKSVATAAVGIRWINNKGKAVFKPVINISDPLAKWMPVPPVAVKEKLIIYENVGLNNNFPNQDIRELTTIDLSQYIKNSQDIPKVELQLSKLFQLKIKINGQETKGERQIHG